MALTHLNSWSKIEKLSRLREFLTYSKGASIKYVRAEGEGGVGPNADVVLRPSKARLREFADKGEGYQKGRKICIRT